MMKPEPSKVLQLRPIGHVENGVQPEQEVSWDAVNSQIVVDEKWADALEGLEDFSHIIVVFWLHRPRDTDPEVPLKVHPEGREDIPLVGTFATRSPRRPNPIGLTAVELLAREGRTLRVRGLDAFDGTPVLDIKPYLVRGDMEPKTSVPEWLRKLWQELDQSRG